MTGLTGVLAFGCGGAMGALGREKAGEGCLPSVEDEWSTFITAHDALSDPGDFGKRQIS